MADPIEIKPVTNPEIGAKAPITLHKRLVELGRIPPNCCHIPATLRGVVGTIRATPKCAILRCRETGNYVQNVAYQRPLAMLRYR